MKKAGVGLEGEAKRIQQTLPDAETLFGTGTTLVKTTENLSPVAGEAEVTYEIGGLAGVETNITHRIYPTGAAAACLSEDQPVNQCHLVPLNGPSHFLSSTGGSVQRRESRS